MLMVFVVCLCCVLHLVWLSSLIVCQKVQENIPKVGLLSSLGNRSKAGSYTVCLTSIDYPQIEGKFTATTGGLTNLFYGCSMIELVLPIIKYTMPPLEVGP